MAETVDEPELNTVEPDRMITVKGPYSTSADPYQTINVKDKQKLIDGYHGQVDSMGRHIGRGLSNFLGSDWLGSKFSNPYKGALYGLGTGAILGLLAHGGSKLIPPRSSMPPEWHAKNPILSQVASWKSPGMLNSVILASILSGIAGGVAGWYKRGSVCDNAGTISSSTQIKSSSLYRSFAPSQDPNDIMMKIVGNAPLIPYEQKLGTMAQVASMSDRQANKFKKLLFISGGINAGLMMNQMAGFGSPISSGALGAAAGWMANKFVQ